MELSHYYGQPIFLEILMRLKPILRARLFCGSLYRQLAVELFFIGISKSSHCNALKDDFHLFIGCPLAMACCLVVGGTFLRMRL